MSCVCGGLASILEQGDINVQRQFACDAALLMGLCMQGIRKRKPAVGTGSGAKSLDAHDYEEQFQKKKLLEETKVEKKRQDDERKARKEQDKESKKRERLLLKVGESCVCRPNWGLWPG